MNSIRQLQEQFAGTGEVRNYEFSLVSVTIRGSCYQIRLDGITTHFEVFRLKINNRWSCISSPTSVAFGIWAWTYKSLDDASRKLNSL